MTALKRFRSQTGREPRAQDVLLVADGIVIGAAEPGARSLVLSEVVRAAATAKEAVEATALCDLDALQQALVDKVLPQNEERLACVGRGAESKLELECPVLAEAHGALHREGTKAGDKKDALLDEASARRDVAFQTSVSNLKRVKRTGWVLRKVPDPESVSDHSFGVALAALLVEDDQIDTAKAVQMGLLHDVAEAIVGDIAPGQGISDEDKHAREQAAMRELLQEKLGGGARADRINALWQEYEARETPEAKLVKDLDRWEMILTADGYEREADSHFLQEFYDGVRGKIKHPRVKAWQKALEEARELRRRDANEKRTETL
ncbi:HD domain-containing protein 2 [Hondaea fermentalgiana]|uniref:5'-deoxynucleotidase n=1 Tax=Hondaea fermentalgiana TaxID=2315210 RepID=A0A2R5GYY1_9STRA|nr:HD domain-containing protein 2 [Hondaea fermentalgiana]|eukprot:GBG33953.1 HD domain-containing protein 2 [Hondaea fermentalgiana]